MKENPQERDIKKDMAPGRIIADGYLGSDTRTLEAIIAEDEAVLTSLGVTKEQVAAKMQAMTMAALEGLGDPMDIDDTYTAQALEFMGFHGCPFKDGKRLAKRNTYVTNKLTEESMVWSDLNIHLIDKHGFFEGKGAQYRLEPNQLVRFLGLEATPEEA